MTQAEIDAISVVSAYLAGEIELTAEDQRELSEIMASIAERLDKQLKESNA